MRVTTFSMYNLVTRSLQKNLRSLFKYSEMLSTGKRINKPSDDAAGIARVLDYKTRIKENNQYMRGLDDAVSYLAFADGAMSSVTSSLTRARELAIQASNDSQSADTRAMIAEEIINLRDEMYNLSNSRFRDRYVFSGFKSDTAAFDSSFVYQGDTNKINVPIDRNATIASNVVGSDAFQYGGDSFMKLLDDFRIALQSNDLTGINNAITDVENMINQTATVRTDLGAKLAFLDKHKFSLEDRNLAFEIFRSNTEDTDIANSTSELAKTQVSLEALRQSGAEFLSQSLMNFLR